MSSTQKGTGTLSPRWANPRLAYDTSAAPALLSKGNELSLKAFSVREEKSTWMNLSA
jgi:hypothetical protein